MESDLYALHVCPAAYYSITFLGVFSSEMFAIDYLKEYTENLFKDMISRNEKNLRGESGFANTLSEEENNSLGLELEKEIELIYKHLGWLKKLDHSLAAYQDFYKRITTGENPYGYDIGKVFLTRLKVNECVKDDFYTHKP